MSKDLPEQAVKDTNTEQKQKKKKSSLLCRIVKTFFVFCFALLCLLCGGIYYITCTHGGAVYALNTAQRFLPESIVLDTSLEEGTLFSGFRLGKTFIEIRDVLSLSADSLELNWDLLRLKDKVFKVESLGAEKLYLSLNDKLFEPAAEKEPPSDTPFRLNFPVDVELDKLYVNYFSLNSKVTDVTFDRLQIKAQASGEKLTVNSLLSEKPLIFLKNADSASDESQTEDYDDTLQAATGLSSQQINDAAEQILSAAQKGDTLALSLSKNESGDTQLQIYSDPEVFADAMEEALLSGKKLPEFRAVRTQVINPENGEPTLDSRKDYEEGLAYTDDQSSDKEESPKAPEVKVFGDGDGMIQPLASVTLPFDLELQDVTVNSVRCYSDSFDTGEISSLIKASFTGTEVEIDLLSAEHEAGKVSAKGSVDLSNFYTFNLTLEGEGSETDTNKNLFEGLLYGLKGSFSVSGNLSDLKVNSKLSLGGTSELNARVNVLSSVFPMVVSLKTEHFAYPLFKDPVADLESIMLSAKGNLSDGIDIALKTDVTGFGFKDVITDFKGRVSLEKSSIEHLSIDGVYLDEPLQAKAEGDVFYGSVYGADLRVYAKVKDAGFIHPLLKGPFFIDADLVSVMNNEESRLGESALSVASTPKHIDSRISKSRVTAEDFDPDRFEEMLLSSSVRVLQPPTTAEGENISQSELGVSFAAAKDSAELSKQQYESLLQHENAALIPEESAAHALFGKDMPDVKADIRKINGELYFNGYKTVIDVKNIVGDLQRGFRIDRLNITQAENSIKASGSLTTEKADFKALADVKSFTSLAPDLKGSFIGELSASGKLSDLNFGISGKSPRIVFGDMRIQKLLLNADFNMQTRAFNFIAMTDSLRLSKSMKASKQCFIDFSGNPLRHALAMNCEGSTAAYVSLDGSMDFEKNRYNANLTEFYFSNEDAGSLSLTNPVFFEFNPESASGSIAKAELSGEIGVVTVSETEFSPGNIQSAIELKNFNLSALRDFYPNGIYMNTPMHMKSKVLVKNGKPDITAEIIGERGLLASAAVSAALAYDSFKINAHMKEDRLTSDFNMKLIRGNGNISAAVNINDPAGKGELDGFLKIDSFDLTSVSNIGMVFNELNGMLNMDMRLGGTLKSPGIFGTIKLKGDALPRYDVGQINNFDFVITADGSKGSVDGSVSLNETPLLIDGVLDWSDGAKGAVTAHTENMPILLLGYGTARANVDAHAVLGEILDIDAQVVIPRGDITVSEVAGSGVTVSADEVIVSAEGTGVQKKPVAEAPALKSRINASLKFGKDVNVKALGMVKGQLAGGLNISKSVEDENIKANGEISLENGEAEVFNRKFNISAADVIFRNEINNPSLNVEVIADKDYIEDDVEVGVRVLGKAAKPDIKLFSKPAMSENEILSYIIYGHGLEKSALSQQPSVNNQSMLLGLGVSSASGLVNSLAGAFGMNNVQVGSQGSGDDTQVQIQGYISKKLRLSYNYGIFNTVGEFKLRYELLHKLYIEYISSLEQAVDLIYSFDFD